MCSANVMTYVVVFPFEGLNEPLGITVSLRVFDERESVGKAAVLSANCLSKSGVALSKGDMIISVNDEPLPPTCRDPVKLLTSLVRKAREESCDVRICFQRGITLFSPPPKNRRPCGSLVYQQRENRAVSADSQASSIVSEGSDNRSRNSSFVSDTQDSMSEKENQCPNNLVSSPSKSMKRYSKQIEDTIAEKGSSSPDRESLIKELSRHLETLTAERNDLLIALDAVQTTCTKLETEKIQIEAAATTAAKVAAEAVRQEQQDDFFFLTKAMGAATDMVDTLEATLRSSAVELCELRAAFAAQSEAHCADRAVLLAQLVEEKEARAHERANFVSRFEDLLKQTPRASDRTNSHVRLDLPEFSRRSPTAHFMWCLVFILGLTVGLLMRVHADRVQPVLIRPPPTLVCRPALAASADEAHSDHSRSISVITEGTYMPPPLMSRRVSNHWTRKPTPVSN